MLEELKQGSKLVGAKQTRRALKDGRAKKLYMAKDADPRLLQPLVQEAVRQGSLGFRRRSAPACGWSRWTPCGSWARPAALPWEPPWPSWCKFSVFFWF